MLQLQNKPLGNTGAIRGYGASGFTLVEMMIVLMIVAMGALIAVENLGSTACRWELDAGATNVSQFIESTAGWAKDQHAPVFLIIRPAQGIIEITSDAGGASVLDSLDIPKDLTLSPNTSLTLRCDTFSRAYLGTGTQMIDTVQNLTLNHQSMINGKVSPQIEYSLTITPLWHVALDRRTL